MKPVRTESEMNKKEKEIHSGFASGNPEKIIEAIKQMRLDGKPEQLPMLFEALLHQENETVLAEAVQLLNDLKDKESLPFLFDALADDRMEYLHIFLLQSIWQSGIDPNEYLEDLVNIGIRSDYAPCFEVLTIIENLPTIPDEEMLLLLTSRLHDAIADSGSTRELLLSMHDVLNNYIIEG
jgi:HEAT repeat protein